MLVAARRTPSELVDLAAFVRELVDRSPFGTAAAFARAAQYPATNLSEVINGQASIDGANLVRLIRTAEAAGAREAGGEGGAGLDPASSTSAATRSDRDRLARVEGEVRKILDLNERSFLEIAARFERLEHQLDGLTSRTGRRRKTG